MNKREWNVWSNLTFKTKSYRKNFDLINKNENIITEYVGEITKLRLEENKSPILIGEYSFSVWNLALARALNVNIIELIKTHKFENTYDELINVIENNNFDIDKYGKFVLIHGLIIRYDYRKFGITEEFVESIYRDFYADNTAIIALIKPIQYNIIDADFYFKDKNVYVRNELSVTNEYNNIPALEYYSLNKLIEKKDAELNELKLCALAQKCGFKQIGDSHLFIFKPKNTIERIKNKQIFLNEISKNLE